MGQEVVAKENARFKPDCLLLGARMGWEEGVGGKEPEGSLSCRLPRYC